MTITEDRRLTVVLSPRGHLLLEARADAPELDPSLARRLRASFERGGGHGLLTLGGREVNTALPPALAYWRDFGGRYMAAVCGDSEAQGGRHSVPAPSEDELAELVLSAPPMEGGDYLATAVLSALWDELGAASAAELRGSGKPIADFLKSLHPVWNLVGRVHFNLAENRRDEEAPFAFLATYTTRVSAQGKAQHLPLGQALREYSGATHKGRLLSLLLPVQRAATQSACASVRIGRPEALGSRRRYRC